MTNGAHPEGGGSKAKSEKEAPKPKGTEEPKEEKKTKS
jgi:hypothetical protein